MAVFLKRFYFFLVKTDHFYIFKKLKKNVQTIWDKTFVHFSRFSKVSFHHKWNRTRLLSQESEYATCLTSCQTTYDLGSKKCGNFKKIPEMLGFDGGYTADQLKVSC